MKKMLFLLFAVALTSALYAEDVVTTREGSASYYIPNYGGLSVYQFDEPELVRKGEKVYRNGLQMTKREYKNFLANTCPEAYKQYTKGTKLVKGGWSTFTIGALMMVLIGTPLYIESWDYYDYDRYYYGHYDDDYDYYRKGRRMEDAGISMMVIGGAAVAASVPMICVGYSKRHKSVDTYNRACSSDDITYNIKVGNNSLGFAVNF